MTEQSYGNAYDGEVLPDVGVATTLTALATASTEPTVVDPEEAGKPHVFLLPPGYSAVVKDFEEHMPRPRRAVSRNRVVRDEKDLIRLCDELGQHPTVYADPVDRKVIAVLNDDVDKETPGWRDDRVELQLVETDEWKAWKNANNELFDQETFAEFIEDWRRTIQSPDGATMLEIAQTLHATVNVRAQSSRRLRDGQRKIQWDESTDATAGEDGSVEIPEEFEIAVVPWKGRDVTPIAMTARLRFRLNGGTVRLGFKLVDVDARLEEAFNDILEPIRETIPVVSGKP